MFKLCAACDGEAPSVICPSCHDEIEGLRLPVGAGAIFAYEPPLQRALVAWKIGARPDLTRYFARALPVLEAEVAVPIPPALRAIWRGLHAPTELARATGLPVERAALLRLSQARQMGRRRSDRRGRDLFVATPWVRRLAGKRVILVDDVVTTGSTLRAALQLLQRAGVQSCESLALARAER